MFHHKKIITVMPERLGDTLMCTPALHYLKHYYPSLQIDIIALSELAASTLQYNPDINQIFVLPSHKFMQKIKHQYDLAINLHDGPLARDYLAVLKIPIQHIPRIDPNQHQAEQALKFIQNLLPKHPQIIDRQYRLSPQSEHFQHVKKLLEQQGINLEQDILIGCHIGCHSISKGRYKIWRKRQPHPKVWPIEHIAELAQKLYQKDKHIRFVITGSKDEIALAKKLCAAEPHVINLVNKTSVLELAALMYYLKLFITPDTGALHVACSTHVPLLALFGPTSLQRTGPYPELDNLTLLQASTMAEINAETVYKAVLQRIYL